MTDNFHVTANIVQNHRFTIQGRAAAVLKPGGFKKTGTPWDNERIADAAQGKV
jgi:hypothetical protein